MDFIRELRKTAFDTASKHNLITDSVATSISVTTTPLNNTLELITEELLLQYSHEFNAISNDISQWFMRMVEGGMTIAIASQFDHNNTMQLKPRSKQRSIAFSFHIQFHLNQKKEAFEQVYAAINAFVCENEALIEDGTVEKIELLQTILLAGALVGIELCNRIEIRKEDFLTIHHELLIEDDELDDLDFEDEEFEDDEDEEMFDQDEDSYEVYCPFCAQPNLFQPKDDKGLKKTEIMFCDHLALGFATDADKKVVGIDYYTYYLEKALIELNGATDDDTTVDFAQLLNAFYINYNVDKELQLMAHLGNFIPEHKHKIKQFVANIDEAQHRFVFHYIKLLKQSK